jgi:hypothetical protein
MDENEFELLYAQQLNEQLSHQTRIAIKTLVENYPHEFGLERLFPSKPNQPMTEKLVELYQQVCAFYSDNVVDFDHVWVFFFIICIKKKTKVFTYSFSIKKKKKKKKIKINK